MTPGNLSHALATTEQLSNEESDMVSMMLFVKDRYDVSGRACHEMAKVCQQMPRHYRVKENIAELNKLWDIRCTPNGTLGVQQSLENRLRVRLRKLVSSCPADAPFKANKKVSQTIRRWYKHRQTFTCD